VTAPLAPAWSAVAEAAGIGAGTSVLDVGCGTGGFCALAAARGALVHGVDGLGDRIDEAQRRVPAGDFRVGLMEALPWPAGAFDVVTGFNSFQYAFDVETALREALRVTRAEGRLAIAKWGRPADNELFVLLARLGGSPQPLDELRDPVDAALERLGLTPELDADVPAVIELADDDALAAALPGKERERVLEAAAPWRRPDGGYRFGNRIRYRIVRADERLGDMFEG
jgi:SAM-dependent methyltransferase